MEIICGKCKTKFEDSEDLLLKKGPLFSYFKCPRCGKIVTVKKIEPAVINSEPTPLNNLENMDYNDNSGAAGIPFFITSATRQQLYDLGYSRLDVDHMSPYNAREIIAAQKKKPAVHREPEMPQVSERKEIPGWLIVHDETVKPQTFDLVVGKNLIGRKSSMQVNIPIETEDMTMSRQHCVIEVVLNERSGEYDFMINDFKSTNGTILNGRVQRKLFEQDVIYLSDGDTFQLGMTKIVFRKNNEVQKKAAIVKEVLGQPYMPTVMINKDQVERFFK